MSQESSKTLRWSWLIEWVPFSRRWYTTQSLRFPPWKEGWLSQKWGVAAMPLCHRWRNMVRNFFFFKHGKHERRTKRNLRFDCKAMPILFLWLFSPGAQKDEMCSDSQLHCDHSSLSGNTTHISETHFQLSHTHWKPHCLKIASLFLNSFSLWLCVSN